MYLNRKQIPNYPFHCSISVSGMTNCPGMTSTEEGFQDMGLSVLKMGKSQANQDKLVTRLRSLPAQSPTPPPQYTNPQESTNNTSVTCTYLFYGPHHPDDCLQVWSL